MHEDVSMPLDIRLGLKIHLVAVPRTKLPSKYSVSEMIVFVHESRVPTSRDPDSRTKDRHTSTEGTSRG